MQTIFPVRVQVIFVSTGGMGGILCNSTMFNEFEFSREGGGGGLQTPDLPPLSSRSA